MVTISSLMPLVLADLPRNIVERLVNDWVSNPEHFWLPYPLPSVPASNPKFMPGQPSGIHLAGAHLGEHKLVPVPLAAGDTDTRNWPIPSSPRPTRAIELSGFREYYNPYTAEGLGARNFGWTTLALDL